MNQVHPDATLLSLLTRLLTVSVKYRLFTSPSSNPGLGATLSTFTEEAGSGYSPVTVAISDWSIQSVIGHQGIFVAPDIAFTPGSATTFTDYGYYVTDASASLLLAYGFFDGGPIVTVNPNSLTLTPKWGNNSKYSS